MNPAGGVLIIAGLWIVCQVFGGRALQRLGVVDPPADGGTITGRGQLLPGAGGGSSGGGSSGGGSVIGRSVFENLLPGGTR